MGMDNSIGVTTQAFGNLYERRNLLRHGMNRFNQGVFFLTKALMDS
jgi:hypothetical protein